MTIKDITACNGFDFEGVEKYSLSVWLLILLLFPLFPQVCIMTSKSQVTYAKMEFILPWKVSCVPIWRGLTCLTKSCNVFLQL